MAATLSSFSSLSIRCTTPRLSLLPPKPTFSLFPKPPPLNSLKLRAASDPNTLEEEPQDWIYNPEEPEEFVDPPYFDEGEEETEDEIAARYEKLYGPVYSGVSVLGNDVMEMDADTRRESSLGVQPRLRFRDEFEERIVQIKRVTKVVKGGKQMNFRIVVVVGDRKGRVGVGVGKAKEIADAVYKSVINARRNVIVVPMTKYLTFPHRADGIFGAAKVMLRPACPGSGVIAGGAVRVVLELAGVQNALGKQLRSKNPLNNARATVVAMQSMRQFHEVAAERGLPMELLWQ